MMRSISSAFAVNMRIGICRVAMSVLSTLQISSPGIFGSMQIENDKRRRFFPRFAEANGSIRRRAQGKAGFAQMKRQQIDHVLFVLDDENSWARHGR